MVVLPVHHLVLLHRLHQLAVVLAVDQELLVELQDFLLELEDRPLAVERGQQFLELLRQLLVELLVLLAPELEHLDGLVGVVAVLLQFVAEVEQVVADLRLEVVGHSQEGAELRLLEEIVEVVDDEHQAFQQVLVVLLYLVAVLPALVIAEIVHVDHDDGLQLVVQLALALLVHPVEVTVDVVVLLAYQDQILLLHFAQVVAEAREVQLALELQLVVEGVLELVQLLDEGEALLLGVVGGVEDGLAAGRPELEEVGLNGGGVLHQEGVQRAFRSLYALHLVLLNPERLGEVEPEVFDQRSEDGLELLHKVEDVLAERRLLEYADGNDLFGVGDDPAEHADL